MTLAEVEQRFGCSRRTAQRMMRNLEIRFGDVDSLQDEDGLKRWRMRGGGLREFLSLDADELAALDMATAQLLRDGQEREARGGGGWNAGQKSCRLVRLIARIDRRIEAREAKRGTDCIGQCENPAVSRQIVQRPQKHDKCRRNPEGDDV